MGGLHCFGIDSYPRLMGRGFGVALLMLNTIRPVVLPVVWAQLAAGDAAIRQGLNAHTLLGRHAPAIFAIAHPLPNGHGRDAERSCKRRPTTNNGNGIEKRRNMRGSHAAKV